MDSQHRHELQQNELGKLTNKAVPFFEKHGWQVIAVLGIVVAGLAIGAYWFTESSATSSESWTQLDKVLHQPNASAGDYAAIAEKHPGSAVAGWARLKEADDYLDSGLQAAFSNRDASQSDLKSAQEAYQKLAAGGPGILPEIRERALFGLARSQEALSDGNTDEVVKTYTRLLKEFPESIFTAIVNDRIKALESASSKDFYAWFKQQKLEPKDPRDVPVKKSPFHSFDVPDEGDKEEMDKPSDGDAEETSESASESKPAEEAADSKPADGDKPDSEKPESETKPSEESGKSDSP